MSSVIIFILDLKFLFYHMSRQSSVLHVRICDQPRSVCQNTPSTMSSPPYPRYVPTSNPFLERFPCTTFFYIINNKKNQFFKSPNICEMAITIFMIFTQKNLLNLVNSIKFCYLQQRYETFIITVLRTSINAVGGQLGD